MIRQHMAIVVVLLVAAAWTAAADDGAFPPASASVISLGGSSADLLIEDLIPTGRLVTVSADSGCFEVFSVRIKRKIDRVRANVLVRFSSRQVRAVKLVLSLMDDSGSVLAQGTHEEEVGPVETTREYARGLHHLTQAWDDPRSIWITFPKEAAWASVFALEIWHLP